MFSVRPVAIFLILVLAFLEGTTSISSLPVQASDWVGWNAINTIYYNPEQEDTYNPYLSTAASELDNYLQQMSGRAWNVTTSAVPLGPAIFLSVDGAAAALNGMGDEAFHLTCDDAGIRITGHTALAVRDGAYELLLRLGVRWFFQGDTWTIVPTSLTDLGALEINDQPDYNFWRGLRPNPADNVAIPDRQVWARRNRLGGAANYYGGEAYPAILQYTFGISTPTQDLWNSHPEYFLPDGPYQSFPWKFQPDNPTVVQMAENYTDHQLDSTPAAPVGYGDILQRAASLIPSDGGGWEPYTDQQASDLVYGLANAVAAYQATSHPDDYIITASYANYSPIPELGTLEPNMIVYVCNGYYRGYTDSTVSERIVAISDKGAVPAIRLFEDIWKVTEDAPMSSLNAITRVPFWYALGARSYENELSNNWGGAGLAYYCIARLLWDPSLDINDLLDDFFDKAFGAAAADMKDYYENTGTDDTSMTRMFNDLAAARIDAAGDTGSLARIQQIETYAYWVWKYHNIGYTNLSDANLEALYTLTCQMRDWYLIDYTQVEAALRTELSSRGYLSGQINTLQDFSMPSNDQVAAMMSEALTAFGSSYTNYINIFNLQLQALNDSTPAASNLVFGYGGGELVIPATNSESITIHYKGPAGANMQMAWYASTGVKIQEFDTTGDDSWCTHTFPTYNDGNYVLYVRYGQSYNVQYYYDGPSAWMVDPDIHFRPPYDFSTNPANRAAFFGTNTLYFWVPQGTNTFTIGIDYQSGSNPDIIGMIADPNNNETTINYTSTETDQTTFNSPTPGLWKVTANFPKYYNYMWLQGIPPLVSNSPASILVDSTANPSAIDLDVNSDGAINILDLIHVVQHLGETGPNGWIKEDVNTDGTVDILDITLAANNWYQ